MPSAKDAYTKKAEKISLIMRKLANEQKKQDP